MKRKMLFVRELGILFLVLVAILSPSCKKETPVDPGKKDTTSVSSLDKVYPKNGLYVRDGYFKKDGKPYYGIGVNYFSMFNFILNGNTTLDGTLKAMDALAEHDIPFVRFSSPFWPNDWKKSYFTDKDSYFKILDKLVARAEKDSIGLIPSLFWNIPSIADIFGEHMDAFGDNSSKTMAFIRSYTAEIVQRYKDSPAIWGWEFGNEFDLQVDIPGGSVPSVVPALGTPDSRDPVHDNFTHEEMENAFVQFATIVRQNDSTRPVFTGNAEPRSSAWHNAKRSSGEYWVADNETQYYSILCDFNPDPVNTITIRSYCNQPGPVTNYPLCLSTPDAFLKKFMEFSKKSGKPLFNGEFAASSEWLEPGSGWTQVSDIKKALQERIDAIVNNGVQLSCYWVYNYYPAENDCNATFNNSRYWVYNMIGKANAAFRLKMEEIK